jgi:hypothetical protein
MKWYMRAVLGGFGRGLWGCLVVATIAVILSLH